MNRSFSQCRRAMRGISLIELMVAMALGLLVSLAAVAVFSVTSRTGRAQNAIAQVQENGRYAIERINRDLRMIGHQSYTASSILSSAPNASGPILTPVIAPESYVASIALPDGAVSAYTAQTAALFGTSGWTVSAHWPLSPAVFLQGYQCTAQGCSPAVPEAFPATGTSIGKRVRGTDVLTMRYIDAMGWSLGAGELVAACDANGFIDTLSISPATSTTQAPNFHDGDLAILATPGAATIFQAQVATDGNAQVLTPNLANGDRVPGCPSSAGIEATLYNFSRDFVTVSYYLALDPVDPDDASRLTPALHRRRSDNAGNVSDVGIAQGIERMDFLYGVQTADGTVGYLTAEQMSGASANCPPPPYQYSANQIANESGCLWRAVKNIEVHLLASGIDDQHDLSPSDLAYQYQGSAAGAFATTGIVVPGAADALDPVTGLRWGKHPRREFVTLVAVRNYNP